jgi:hypothetical protein
MPCLGAKSGCKVRFARSVCHDAPSPPAVHLPQASPPSAVAAELLGGADLAPGSGLAVRCTGVRSCEGEAVVNNRKNKIIAAYELAVVLGWECGDADGAGIAVSGEVRLPYVSEENYDEDPDLQVGSGWGGLECAVSCAYQACPSVWPGRGIARMVAVIFCAANQPREDDKGDGAAWRAPGGEPDQEPALCRPSHRRLPQAPRVPPRRKPSRPSSAAARRCGSARGCLLELAIPAAAAAAAADSERGRLGHDALTLCWATCRHPPRPGR